MISNAPIVTPVVDGSQRSTFAWTGWYTQIAQAINAILGNYKTYTLSAAASSPMTVATVIGYGEYLAFGSVCHIRMYWKGVLGGTAAGEVTLSLPYVPAGQYNVPFACQAYTSAAGWTSVPAYIPPGGNAVAIFLQGQATFPLGDTFFQLNAVYRIK